MPYEVKDGYVCDMEGEECLAKYDFGDAEFKVKFFDFGNQVKKRADTISEIFENEKKAIAGTLTEFDEFVLEAKVELRVTNEMFDEASALLGDRFCDRHVGQNRKNLLRLWLAIAELANMSKEANKAMADELEAFSKGAVNRAQKRHPTRK